MNRKTRESLKFFSEQLFGVSSRWQKMMNDPAYRVVVSEEETDQPEYLYYADEKTGQKTVVRYETALARGWALPTETKGKNYKWRKPTEEEMVSILLGLRMKVAEEYLDEQDFIALAAYYTKVTLTLYPGVLLLCRDEEEKEQVRSMLNSDDYLARFLTLEAVKTHRMISAKTFAQNIKLVEHKDSDKVADKIEELLQKAVLIRDETRKKLAKSAK